MPARPPSASSSWRAPRRCWPAGPALVPIAVLIAAPFRPPIAFDQLEPLPGLDRRGRAPRTTAAALLSCWPPRPPRSAGAALRDRPLRALPTAIALPAAAFFAFAFISLLVGGRRRGGRQPARVLHAAVRRPAGHCRTGRVPRLRCRARSRRWRSRWRPCSRRSASGRRPRTSSSSTRPNLAVSNANTDYFRVTSLFGDPSLYGRHVVLGIGVALALLAARRWRTWPLIGAARADVGGPALLVLAVEHGRAAAGHARARDRRPATGACAGPSGVLALVAALVAGGTSPLQADRRAGS